MTASDCQQQSQVNIHQHKGIQKWNNYAGISKEVRDFNTKAGANFQCQYPPQGISNVMDYVKYIPSRDYFASIIKENIK
jgi:hypothetical protein